MVVKEKMPELDLPEKEPGDAILNYQKHMKKIKGFVDFAKVDGNREYFKKFNAAHEGRFEKAEDISKLNGKYKTCVGHTFALCERNTDIPGTLKNEHIQKNGNDHDIFIDVKADYVKPSLTTGMVDMNRFHNNREKAENTYKIPGKTNFEGIGNRSDPWSYDPNKVRMGHNVLSTSRN